MADNNVVWGNYKIPLQTHYDSRVIKMSDIEETSNGNDVLTITFVHNFYDPDEDDKQGSFWFTAKFYKDNATRHEKYVSIGDMVLVIPTFPMQISTSNSEEYGDRINCSFFSPNLKYLPKGEKKESSKSTERKERPKSNRSNNGGSRGRRPATKTGRPKKKKKSEDEEYFRQ